MVACQGVIYCKSLVLLYMYVICTENLLSVILSVHI